MTGGAIILMMIRLRKLRGVTGIACSLRASDTQPLEELDNDRINATLEPPSYPMGNWRRGPLRNSHKIGAAFQSHIPANPS